MFVCAVCCDDHDMSKCYIASGCGHRLCCEAACGILLAAIQCV